MINEKRREIQLESIEALAENNYEGIVILPTGTGKGWVLIDILNRVKPKKAIYLCDSEDNRDKTFKDDLKKWGAEDWIPYIQFECYQTAHKFKGEEYDLVLGDEFDFALTPKYSRFFFNNKCKHKCLVSATLSEEKRQLAVKIAPIVYEKNIQEIEDDGILNQADYFFVNYMLTPAENKEYLRFNDKFISLIAEKEEVSNDPSLTNEERRNKLAKLKDSSEFWINSRTLFLKGLKSSEKTCKSLLKDIYLQNVTNRILIFCGLTTQADNICKYSYHGKNEGENWLEKFNSGQVRLITVVGKVDRGMNLHKVNNIVFESPSKSKTKFIQKSGRGRRLELDEVLAVYFLIPYYRTRKGFIKPTVVEKWVYESMKGIDLSNAKTYQVK